LTFAQAASSSPQVQSSRRELGATSSSAVGSSLLASSKKHPVVEAAAAWSPAPACRCDGETPATCVWQAGKAATAASTIDMGSNDANTPTGAACAYKVWLN
jgi:hypothetical protein